MPKMAITNSIRLDWEIILPRITELGITDLAMAMGISRSALSSTLGRVRRGLPVTPRTARNLARGLGVTVREIRVQGDCRPLIPLPPQYTNPKPLRGRRQG